MYRQKPKSWTLYGCNDANANSEEGKDSESWEVIDAVTNDKQLKDVNYEKYDYELTGSTSTKYQYFKLEITATQGADVMQMSEFILDYSTCDHNLEATGETVAPTCTEGGYDVYECSICHWQKKVSTAEALGHDFVDEVCTRCGVADTTPREPATNKSGVYQIGTAAELYWFAGLVNGTLTDGTAQNTSANAVLTADITVNSELLESLTYDDDGNVTNGESFTSWTPIGNGSSSYTGTFNGQGHTVSGLYFNDTSTDYVGLFGYVGNGGKISNVGVEDSYFNGNVGVGGVCGLNYGEITNCYNTGEVSGYGYVGGVCGYNAKGTITNCYNTGEVSGAAQVGGVCGYNYYGTITNCYSLETTDSLSAVGVNYNCSSNAKTKTAGQFQSGEVCYFLNGADDVFIWRQNLETDASPVLNNTHGKVYASYPCPAEFSNTKAGIPTVEHDFQDGICSVCGAFENEPEQVGGV